MRNSMNVKASQKGFTLIELVVVIVILGILAVTAAPKFIDLTGDAKASVVQAVEGSLNSAADMAHAKALIDGTGNDLSIAGATVSFTNGYPDAASMEALMEVDTDASEGDFVFNESGGTATYSHAKATEQTNCRAIYVNALSDARPSISSIVTGC